MQGVGNRTGAVVPASDPSCVTASPYIRQVTNLVASPNHLLNCVRCSCRSVSQASLDDCSGASDRGGRWSAPSWRGVTRARSAVLVGESGWGHDEHGSDRGDRCLAEISHLILSPPELAVGLVLNLHLQRLLRWIRPYGVLVPPVTELFTQRLGMQEATTAPDGSLSAYAATN